MPKLCYLVKKSITTGIVLCGRCAKGLAPYTLPQTLHGSLTSYPKDRTGKIHLCLRYVCDQRLSQPGEWHDLPQWGQGVAAVAGK